MVMYSSMSYRNPGDPLKEIATQVPHRTLKRSRFGETLPGLSRPSELQRGSGIRIGIARVDTECDHLTNEQTDACSSFFVVEKICADQRRRGHNVLTFYDYGLVTKLFGEFFISINSMFVECQPVTTMILWICIRPGYPQCWVKFSFSMPDY